MRPTWYSSARLRMELALLPRSGNEACTGGGASGTAIWPPPEPGFASWVHAALAPQASRLTCNRNVKRRFFTCGYQTTDTASGSEDLGEPLPPAPRGLEAHR